MEFCREKLYRQDSSFQPFASWKEGVSVCSPHAKNSVTGQSSSSGPVTKSGADGCRLQIQSPEAEWRLWSTKWKFPYLHIAPSQCIYLKSSWRSAPRHLQMETLGSHWGLASQQKGSGFNLSGPFHAGFVCYYCACAGFQGALQVPPETAVSILIFHIEVFLLASLF